MICISGKFECFPEEMIILSCGNSSFSCGNSSFPCGNSPFLQEVKWKWKNGNIFSIFGGPFSCKVDGRCFTRLITGTRRVGSHFFQRIKKIPVLGIIMLIRFVVFRNHSLSSTKKRKKTLLKAIYPVPRGTDRIHFVSDLKRTSIVENKKWKEAFKNLSWTPSGFPTFVDR